MTAKTFTISNLGSQSITVTGITFNTPTGISHTANLTGLGGIAVFTGATATVSKIIPAAGTATFSVDHSYVSGIAGTKTGTIQITGTNGASCTINTTIIVGANTEPWDSTLWDSSLWDR